MIKKEIKHFYPYYKSDTPFFKGLGILTYDIFKYKDLIWQLAYRDIFSLYKRSVIGFFWIVLTPFFQIITWLLLKKTTILNPGELDIPYPVYLLIGTIFWGLFISIFNSSLNVFQQSRMMMMRVKLPFEIFFVVSIIVKLIPFFISLLIIIPILLLFNISLSFNLILIPLAVIPLITLASALGMIFSLLSSLSYDFKRAVNSFFNLLMFFTPIVYSLDKIESGLFKTIVIYNPLSHFIPSMRDLLFSDSLIFSNGYIFSSLFSFGLVLFAWRLLSLTSNRVLERIY